MPLTTDYLKGLAREKAIKYNIDPDLFERQIQQESAFNPNAIGPETRKWGRAKGLGQFIDATAQRFGLTPETVFDPDKNLDASARYMRLLQNQFKSPRLALAAYNWGEGNIESQKPWPKETRDYVNLIAGGGSVPPAPVLSAHKPQPVSPVPTGRTVPPVPTTPEIRTAQPVDLREWMSTTFLGDPNEGLPAAGASAGIPIEPEPSGPSTGDLLGLGLTALPIAKAPLALRDLVAIGTQFLGGPVGGEVGEALGGEPGREWGELIGSMVPTFPGRAAMKSDVVAIPPIGPLEGTKVLTREGLARPVGHGTPHAYDLPDFSKMSNPEQLLYGPGYYTSEALNSPKSPLPGYTGLHVRRNLEFAIKEQSRTLREAARNMVAVKQQLKKKLPPQAAKGVLKDLESGSLSHNYIQDLKNEHGDEVADLAYQANDLLMLPYRIQELIQEQQQALKNLNIRPNIRPMYLNIKNPLDIDGTVPPEQLKKITTVLENRKDPDLTDLVEELKFATQKGEPGRGDRLYNALVNNLGSKVETNKILKDSGFDGITHIGGTIRGNMKHRVHIAFDPEQVKPYFSPEFSDAQAARVAAIAAKKELAKQRQAQKQLERLQAENARLKKNLGIGE